MGNNERKAEVREMEEGSIAARYYDSFKALLAFLTLKFPEVDEITAVAIAGAIMGVALSCKDDALNHGEMVQQTPEAFNPLEQTFMVNFKSAYKEHREMHLRIREGEASVDELLQKMCESHSAKKG